MKDTTLDLSQPLRVEQDTHIAGVSRELLQPGNITLKSELTHDEINKVVRLEFLGTVYGAKYMDTLKRNLLELRVSLDRKSRQEFIQGLGGERDANTGGFFKKLFSRGENHG